MAQLPKCSVARGHSKQIHFSWATAHLHSIYWPHLFQVISCLLLNGHATMVLLTSGKNKSSSFTVPWFQQAEANLIIHQKSTKPVESWLNLTIRALLLEWNMCQSVRFASPFWNGWIWTSLKVRVISFDNDILVALPSFAMVCKMTLLYICIYIHTI